MKSLIKPAAVLGIAGTLALAAMSPTQARVRHWSGPGLGFAVGAAIAGAAASSAYYNGYYGPGYGAYAYEPGYGPAYVDPGYEPYGYTYGYAPSYNDYPAQTRQRTLGGYDY